MIQIFVAEKTFEGCDGLVVTEEMKVTIAAAACLLLLGFNDTFCFDSVRTLLIYPRPTQQRMVHRGDGVVNESQWLSGMIQHGGPVILSWSDVRHNCRDPGSLNNVVIHEFAHYIDGLDGSMEGAPPMPSSALAEQWRSVAAQELERLRQAVSSRVPTVLDPYGMHSPAEFFAVATEAFYCDGGTLREHHAELYSLLAALYQVETGDWFQQEY